MRPQNPQFWVECGQCRGDLNSDGLLDGLDLLVFELYEGPAAAEPLCRLQRQRKRRHLRRADPPLPDQRLERRAGRRAATPSDPASVRARRATPTVRCSTSCCSVVCAEDPACCSVVWDADCVTFADNLCQPLAADTRPDAGNCLCPHEWGSGRHPGLHDTGCATDPVSRTTCVELAPCEPLHEPPAPDRGLRDRPGLRADADRRRTRRLGRGRPRRPRDLPAAGTADQGFGGERTPVLPDAPSKKVPRPLQAQLDFDPATPLHHRQRLLPPAGTPLFNSEISECLGVLAQNYLGCATMFAAGNWDEACIQVADRLCQFPEPLTLGLGDCLRPTPEAAARRLLHRAGLRDRSNLLHQWDTRCVDIAAARVLVPADVLGQADVEAVGAIERRGRRGTLPMWLAGDRVVLLPELHAVLP